MWPRPRDTYILRRHTKTKLVEFQLTIKLNHKSDNRTKATRSPQQRGRLTIVMIAVGSIARRSWWSPIPPPTLCMKIKSSYSSKKKLNYQWETRKVVDRRSKTTDRRQSCNDRWRRHLPTEPERHTRPRSTSMDTVCVCGCVWHTLNCHINLNAD